MATNITKPQVEVIPSTELPGLEKAIHSVEALTAQLFPLREKARTLEVKTKSDYMEIGQVLSETRNLRKQGVAHFSPFDLIVDRVRTFLRTKRLKHENTCEEIEGLCLPKMKAYERAEIDAAKAEEKQINKKSENPVEVAPDIPATPGYRRSTTYPVEVVDADKLLKAWERADGERRKYLRRFITIDIKEVAAEARRVKEPEKLMHMIPGIKAWTE